jgi:hypothetical protein
MEKYLRQYAEPEVAALAGLLETLEESWQWANVVVIPACNETDDFFRSPPPGEGHSLMILVINESVAANDKVSLRNQALAASVAEKFVLQWRSSSEFSEFEISLFRDSSCRRDVLLVDRFNAGRQLPLKGGVGHARKIGVDLAANLICLKRIVSRWIHCTDADVQLPDTYFTCSDAVSDPKSQIAVLNYPFQHSDDQAQSESKKVILATQLYELSLRYYVAGMKLAQSPYAFHTIGSTMAVSALHYAKVRGFPKREAGEDFYLLNKLAKVGSVLELDVSKECQPIEIASRTSDRVPFGTGAAVIKITDFEDPVMGFRFYDPLVFEMLGLWLKSWPAIWESQSTEFASAVYSESTEILTGNQEALVNGLLEIKTEQALVHAFRQSKSLAQFTQQMHIWFDAFRTLKLIHNLRDSGLPGIDYATLAGKQIYTSLLVIDSDLNAFHNRLLNNLSQQPTMVY